MIRLRVRGEHLMVAAGLFVEAGVTWTPVGGNEVEIPDDALARLDAEQRTELAKLVRDPLPETSSPGEFYRGPSTRDAGTSPAGDGTRMSVQVGPEPAGPPGAGDGADTETANVSVGEAPPKSGPGASRAAWAAHAEELRTAGHPIPEVPESMSRDDIIELVEAHRAR